MTAAPELLQPIAKAHQYITFTTPTSLQQAVAEGLASSDDYYKTLSEGLAVRRDRLAAGLRDLGFTVLSCSGSYFLNADIRSVGFNGTDADFCRNLTTEVGVAAVPVSAFYNQDGIHHSPGSASPRRTRHRRGLEAHGQALQGRAYLTPSPPMG